MGFIVLIIVVWAIAIGAWMLVSRYATSADVQKIKDRLVGVNKGKKSSKKGADPEQQSVIHGQAQSPSRIAQLLVDKYKLGPKIQELLEQAGLRWPPARLVHLCLGAFPGRGVTAYILLAIPNALDLLVGAAAGWAPLLYVWAKRR